MNMMIDDTSSSHAPSTHSINEMRLALGLYSAYSAIQFYSIPAKLSKQICNLRIRI